MHSIENYDRVMKMRSESGLGAKSISKNLNVPIGAVSNWIYLGFVPYDKQNQIKKQKLINNDHFSYVKGATQGDGYLSISPSQYRVILKVKDKDFAEFFKMSLDTWTDENSIIKFKESTKEWMVILYRRHVAEFVNENEVSNFIEFLKGFYDAEGYATISDKNWGWIRKDGTKCFKYSRVIGLVNTNLELLKKIKEFYAKNEVIVSIYKMSSKIGDLRKIKGRGFVVKNDCWTLNIQNRKGFEWFYKNIGFRIGRKQEKVIEILKSFSEEKWPEKDIEFLINIYGKISAKEISKALGHSLPSVYHKACRLRITRGIKNG